VANGVIERFIGSVRRECLDHVIILNAAGLRCLLKQYVAYYEAFVCVIEVPATMRLQMVPICRLEDHGIVLIEADSAYRLQR
jgi:hypothetical protein